MVAIGLGMSVAFTDQITFWFWRQLRTGLPPGPRPPEGSQDAHLACTPLTKPGRRPGWSAPQFTQSPPMGQQPSNPTILGGGQVVAKRNHGKAVVAWEMVAAEAQTVSGDGMEAGFPLQPVRWLTLLECI